MSTAPDRGLAAGAAPATEADRAILRTVTYAALFQAPVSLEALHRALMDVPLDAAALRERLERPFLRERLAVSGGFVFPRGREAWLDLKQARQRRSRELVERHRPLLRRVAAFPFVRLVALSGACAHENATDDDVDVFLVTRRGRAWGVALSLILLCKWAGLRRSLCLNHILDEDAVALAERDLFTATEIVGMRPLAGGAAYRGFVAANAWVLDRYPNFFASYMDESSHVPAAGGPRWLERLLDFGPAQMLEFVSRRLLGAHLRRKARGRPGVHLSPHRLKLHIRDHRPSLSDAYVAALREIGEEAP